MHTLILDPDKAATDITALRADAAHLTPITLPPIPSFEPLSNLRTALTHAVDVTNEQAALLSREASRVADNMDVLTTAAVKTDAATGQRLGAIQP